MHLRRDFLLLSVVGLLSGHGAPGGRLVVAAEPPARFDAAPFATLLAEGNGLVWEDPRKLHEVVVRFEKPVSPAVHPRLEYWMQPRGWPRRHLPKDREPGGGAP